MTVRRFLLSCLLVAVVGGATAVGAVAGGTAVFVAARGQLQAAQTAAATTAPVAEPVSQAPAVDTNTAVEAAVAKVGPAVVTVVNDLGGGQQASGSGVFISADGYLVTNNHVVEGSQSLHVIYSDGTQVDGQLVGTDPYVDIAVIKVNGTVPAFAAFGNSDVLNPARRLSPSACRRVTSTTR